MGIQTHDNKGHLKGLEQFSHSPKWKNLGVMSDIDEYRSGYNGGTKIKGTFRVDPQSLNDCTHLSFDTTVDVTPTEFEKAYEERNETWQEIQQSVQWAKQDAMENAHEQIANKQRNCDHSRR